MTVSHCLFAAYDVSISSHVMQASKMTALHWATFAVFEEVINCLLKHGANIDYRNTVVSNTCRCVSLATVSVCSMYISGRVCISELHAVCGKL
jgi:hypothetical protein